MTEKKKDWRKLEFFTPINKSVSINKDFFITGTAISEETTRNNIKYIASELELAAPTFRGKKILLDHRNEVKAIVGVISKSFFNPTTKAIEFEANIMDKEIQGMISDGRISEVSIGAKVQDLIKNKDSDVVTAIGIEGLEISLVAIPGSKNTTIDFGQSLENSFVLKEKLEMERDLIEGYEEIMKQEKRRNFISKEKKEEVKIRDEDKSLVIKQIPSTRTTQANYSENKKLKRLNR